MTTYSQADRTLEFRTSSLKIYGFAAAMLALTAASLFMLVSGSGPQKWLGVVGLALFGVPSAMAFVRARRHVGRATLILSPQGFHDVRVADELVPWAAVKDVTQKAVGRHSYAIVVTFYDTTVAGFDHEAGRGRLNKLIGTDGLAIDASDLEGGFDYVLEMFQIYLKVHGKPFGRR